MHSNKKYSLCKTAQKSRPVQQTIKGRPDRREDFRSTDITVGFLIAWNENKNVCKVLKEIKIIIERKRLETDN